MYVSSRCQIISPISPWVVASYFLLAYPLYPYILHNVLGPPKVDSAGALWIQAIGYQTAGLAVSQVILVGVALFKGSYQTAILAAAALAITTYA